MKRKKACAIAAIGAVICVAAGTGYYFFSQKEIEPERPVLPEGAALSEDSVSAAGLTSVGMLEETCELGFLEEGLYVQEIYLNAGDEVEAGTAVFKVSEESLENARRELEKKVRETELNRRQGAIAYETGLVEAQKEKELAAVEAKYAQDDYDNAVAAARDETDALQEKVDEAQKKVDEYTASIEEDYYFTYYEVGEKEAAWKDNAAFLMELYREWNVEALEDIFGGSSGRNGIGYVTNQVSGAGVSSSGGAAEQSGGGRTVGAAAAGTAQAGNPDGASGVSFSAETVFGAYFAQESVNGENPDTADEAESINENDAGSGQADEGDVGTATAEGGTAGDVGSAGSGQADESGSGGESGEAGTAESDASLGSGTGNDDGDENDAAYEKGDGGAKEPAGMGADGFSGFRGPGGASVSGNDIGMGGGVNVGDDEIRYNIYLAMEEETEESEQVYKTAQENYENAKKQAEAGIAEAKSELAVLKAQLEEQQTAYEKAVISAKLTYDLAVSNYENAQMVYDSSVKQLSEEYEALKEEEETAAENLALFEETLGDGIFYTSAAGTVRMTMVRASQRITEDTVVIAYSNPDTVTVVAYVDQSDIASVEIGQEALVLIGGYGSYAGRVTAVDPISESNTSSVSYAVNVQLEGDVSELEANLTAYIYLRLTEEEREMMSGAGSVGGSRDDERKSEKLQDGSPLEKAGEGERMENFRGGAHAGSSSESGGGFSLRTEDNEETVHE